MRSCAHADDPIERDHELGAIAEALAAAPSDGGRLVTIEGEPGSGKSTLLAAARRRAQLAGAGVLLARGEELEQEFPFGVALQLVEPLVTAAEPTTREALLAGRAAPAAALLESSAPASEGDYTLVRALRAVVSNLTSATDRPVLVVVDDAHWSDSASMRFLVHLAGGLESLPVVVVVTAPAGHPAITRLGETVNGRLRSLRLEALTKSGVARLARQALADVPDELVEKCRLLTGGNPLYASALLEDAKAAGLNGRTTDHLDELVPAPVMRSLRTRLERLPDEAAALASAAAVLGDGTHVRRAATIAGIDSEAAERAADALAAAHVVEPRLQLAFRCPLVRSAVYADTPVLKRSGAHRRAADLLRREDAAPQAVADHLLLASPAGDPATVETLCAVAAEASARREHAKARLLLDRALAEPPAPDQRARVVVALALADAAGGTSEAVARVRNVVRRLPAGTERAGALQALGRLLFARSEFGAAAKAVDQAIAEAEPESALARDLIADSMTIGSFDPALRASAAADTGRLLDTSAEHYLPIEPRIRGVVAMGMLTGGSPAADVRDVALSALAEAPDDDGFYGITIGGAVMALVFVDELDLIAEPIRRAVTGARAAGSVISTGFTAHWQAMLDYQRGALEDAIAHSKLSLEACKSGWDLCVPWVGPLLAHAHIDLGELDQAEQALRLLHGVSRDGLEGALGLEARGRLALERGQPARALDDFRAAGALLADAQVEGLAVCAWRPGAALAAHQVGDTATAAALAQRELAAARAFGAPRALGIALRTAGLIGAAGHRLELLTEAVAVLERSPSRLEYARALVDLGTALLRAGQSRASREPLRRGLALAESLSARPLAERAREELRTAGGRRGKRRPESGPESLTPTQRRIAERAAIGQSTPEIARSLFVAPRTVEWHLGQVYNQLGIGSRRELAGAMRGDPSLRKVHA